MVRRRVLNRASVRWLTVSLMTTITGLVGFVGTGSTKAAGASYTLIEKWPQIPSGQQLGTVSWLDIDREGVVYMFRRCPFECAHPKDGDPPGTIWRFDKSGRFLGEWGQPSAKEAHGLRIDREGFVWTTDVQSHQAKKFRPDGTLVMALGKYGVPGEGSDSFNQPTDVAIASTGAIFVTDGYGNHRVVKFSKDGKFIKAWGTKGNGPGQFRLPHSIAIDSRDNVIVADRCGLAATGCTDNRIQVFDSDGKFLHQWTHLGGGSVYITRDDRLFVSGSGRISIADPRTGNLLDAIEGAGGHGIAVDAIGDVYTAGLGAGVRRYTRQVAK